MLLIFAQILLNYSKEVSVVAQLLGSFHESIGLTRSSALLTVGNKLKFHFGFFFQLCLHLLVQSEEFRFLFSDVLRTVLGRVKPQRESLHALTNRPNFIKTEYKRSKSGYIYNNWTEASFCLSTLGRIFWEWNHCQMAVPVSSWFGWVELREVNTQYWKEASRTGQSRAERKAAGESCSISQVGAGFHNQKKAESRRKALCDAPWWASQKTSSFTQHAPLTCFIPATRTWLWNWRQELENKKIQSQNTFFPH